MGTTNLGALVLEDGGVGGTSATPLTGYKVYSQTITAAPVAAATCAEQTCTVTGLSTGDVVVVNPGAILNSIGVAHARVSAANSLTIMYCNPTAGALTPTAVAYKITAFRS